MKIETLLFSLHGRIPRQKFWIFNTLVMAAYWIVFFTVLLKIGPSLASLIIICVFLYPHLAISVKRWHDLDKSGWWVLVFLIPIIGWFWGLYECGFKKGTSGENQFGPDPLAAA